MNQGQSKISNLRSASKISHTYPDNFIEIYESTFMSRVKNNDSEKLSRPSSKVEKTAICLEQDLNQDFKVVGLIFKNYEPSSSELLIYLIVVPRHQEHVERDLMRYAIELTENMHDGKLQKLSPIKNSPTAFDSGSIEKALVQASKLSELADNKIDVLYALHGYTDVYEKYNQFLLLCFPQDEDSTPINGGLLAGFLFEFYKAYDDNFINMYTYLTKKTRQVTLPDSISEKPKLLKEVLTRTSICFHFVERNVPADVPFDYDAVFGSMERDLLKYQFQANPPLDSSHCLSGNLKITFPSSFDFQSEGQLVELKNQRDPRSVNFMLNKTVFLKSGIRIWHLTLSTEDNDPLNEFEIIKLISLYDGRSENTGPYTKLTDKHPSNHKLAHEIKFKFDTIPNPVPIDQLISGLITESLKKNRSNELIPHPKLKSGTIQMMLKNSQHMQLLRQATQARTDVAAHAALVKEMEERTRDKEILQALSGIAIGIFDFEETDIEEILDTFEPSFSDDNIFIKFNRCTLLSIVKKDRAWDTSKDKIGISPYLIIPHAVLIHNEELAEMAEEEIDGLDENKERRLTNLRQLERVYVKADRYLHSSYLPMIFNYPTEKTLYDKGNENRGSLEKYRVVQFKLRELRIQIESLWQTRRSIAQVFITIVATSVSVVMAIRSQLGDFEIGALAILGIIVVALSLSMIGNLTFNRKLKSNH